MSTTIGTQPGSSPKAETQRGGHPVDLRFASKATESRSSSVGFNSARCKGKPAFGAAAAYYGWQVITKGVVAIIYYQVIASGLRHLISPLGQKLSRIPGLGFLDRYDLTYRLDLAACFSMALLFSVYHLWHRVLCLWLMVDEDIENVSGNRNRQIKFLVGMAVAILGADAWLFYLGITTTGWGGGGFSLAALLGCCAYIGVLLFTCYYSIVLKQRMEDSRSAV